MNRSLCFVLLSFGCLALVGCGGNEPPAPSAVGTDAVQQDDESTDNESTSDDANVAENSDTEEDAVDSEPMPNEHNHSWSPPKSLAEAIKMVADTHEEIRVAFVDNAGDGVDEPMHNMAHHVESVEQFLGSSDLAVKEKAKVVAALTTLYQSFTKISEGTDYADVADALNGAVTSLQGVIGGKEASE